MSTRWTSNSSFANLGTGPSGVGAFCAWVLPLAFTGTYGVFLLMGGLHYVGIHPNVIFIYTTSEADGSPLSLGTWYHVGLNWNESTGFQQAFLNGVFDVDQIDFAGSTPGLEFGNSAGSFYFDGAMRGARAWDGANLSGAEFLAESLSVNPVRLADFYDQWDFKNASLAAASLSGAHDLSVGSLSDGPSDPPPYRAVLGGIFPGVMP